VFDCNVGVSYIHLHSYPFLFLLFPDIKLSPSSFDKEDGDSEKERACFKDEMTQNDDVDDSEKEKCCKEKIHRNTCPVKDKSEISTEKCDISDKSGKDSPHGLKFESLRTFQDKYSCGFFLYNIFLSQNHRRHHSGSFHL
jgi:hypothetical protein